MGSYNDMPPEYREVKINLSPTYKWIMPIGDDIMWNIVREAKQICPELVVSIAQFPNDLRRIFWATHHFKGGIIRYSAELLLVRGVTFNLRQADKWFHEVGHGMINATALSGRS